MKIEPFVLGERGERIFGIVEKPDTGTCFPVVVMLHGFTGEHISSFFKFSRISRKLNEAGIATVRFDFLGSGNSDGEFKDVTPTSEAADALRVMEMVEGSDWFNGKLGIVGYSLGALITSIVIPGIPRLRSICFWAPGIINGGSVFEKFFAFSGARKAENNLFDIGSLLLNEKFIEEVNSIEVNEKLEQFKGVVKIITGTRDEFIDYGAACNFAKAKGYLFHGIEGANHRFDRLEHFTELSENTVEFFKNTLN